MRHYFVSLSLSSLYRDLYGKSNRYVCSNVTENVLTISATRQNMRREWVSLQYFYNIPGHWKLYVGATRWIYRRLVHTVLFRGGILAGSGWWQVQNQMKRPTTTMLRRNKIFLRQPLSINFIVSISAYLYVVCINKLAHNLNIVFHVNRVFCVWLKMCGSNRRFVHRIDFMVDEVMPPPSTNTTTTIDLCDILAVSFFPPLQNL